MPIYEAWCGPCRRVIEWYASTRTEENPICECGRETARLASRFGVVFTGPITTKYNDRRAENAHQEGHWAYRVRSSKSGHPEPVYIDNFQQQKQFCKEEGLVNPRDLPNMDADSEGKMKGNAGVGMPGAWT